jgi:hypothetical protein
MSIIENVVWIIRRDVSESPDFALFWMSKMISIVWVRSYDITYSGLWLVIVSESSFLVFFFKVIVVFSYSLVDWELFFSIESITFWYLAEITFSKYLRNSINLVNRAITVGVEFLTCARLRR